MIGAEAVDLEQVFLQLNRDRTRRQRDGIGEHRSRQVAGKVGSVFDYLGIYGQPGVQDDLRHVVIGLDYLPDKPEQEPGKPEQDHGGYARVQGPPQEGTVRTATKAEHTAPRTRS